MIYEVGSSTIEGAIAETLPLLAARGFAVPDRPGIRLRTLDDVFPYAAAENITLLTDGTETQVRRPARDCLGVAVLAQRGAGPEAVLTGRPSTWGAGADLVASACAR